MEPIGEDRGERRSASDDAIAIQPAENVGGFVFWRGRRRGHNDSSHLYDKYLLAVQVVSQRGQMTATQLFSVDAATDVAGYRILVSYGETSQEYRLPGGEHTDC